MPIFPTWNISYTGPFLPRSLPSPPSPSRTGLWLPQQLGRCAFRCWLLLPASPQQIRASRDTRREIQAGTEGQELQEKGCNSGASQHDARRTENRRKVQAGWCPTTVLGFRKRGTAAGRKKRAGEVGKRSGYSPAALPAGRAGSLSPCHGRSRQPLTLGTAKLIAAAVKICINPPLPSQRGRSGRLIVSFIPL